MDLVIPLGAGSLWNNWELRYALRSWAMHYPEADPLVVGIRPSWYKGRHVHAEDRHQLNANTTRKLLKVIDTLTDRFIWSADDIYLLAPPKWGPFHLATSPANRAPYYWRVLPEGRDHELHIPVMLERERMRHILTKMPEPKRMALRSSYFQGMPSTPMDDVKVPATPKEGWWCFSSEESSPFKQDFKYFMIQQYPTPSPWE